MKKDIKNFSGWSEDEIEDRTIARNVAGQLERICKVKAIVINAMTKRNDEGVTVHLKVFPIGVASEGESEWMKRCSIVARCLKNGPSMLTGSIDGKKISAIPGSMEVPMRSAEMLIDQMKRVMKHDKDFGKMPPHNERKVE